MIQKNNAFSAIILAGGNSSRMKSKKSKLLHIMHGQPLIYYPVYAASQLSPKKIIVVINPRGNPIKKALSKFKNVEFALQEEPLGTAHACLQAMANLKNVSGPVIIMPGDMPLINANILKTLVLNFKSTPTKKSSLLSFLYTTLHNPFGYGRVVFDKKTNLPMKIIEQADLTPAQHAIDTINTGVYCVDKNFLLTGLKNIKNKNAQSEFYLTDLIEMAFKIKRISSTYIADYKSVVGVNTRLDLLKARNYYKSNED